MSLADHRRVRRQKQTDRLQNKDISNVHEVRQADITEKPLSGTSKNTPALTVALLHYNDRSPQLGQKPLNSLSSLEAIAAADNTSYLRRMPRQKEKVEQSDKQLASFVCRVTHPIQIPQHQNTFVIHSDVRNIL